MGRSGARSAPPASAWPRTVIVVVAVAVVVVEVVTTTAFIFSINMHMYVIIQLSQPLVQLLRPMGSKERGVSQAAIHIPIHV